MAQGKIISIKDKFATKREPGVSSIEFYQCKFDEGQIIGKCLPKSVWLFVYGMTTPDWAATPLDAGTQKVIQGGMIVLLDRGNLLSPHVQG
jgi:hypothetical protein